MTRAELMARIAALTDEEFERVRPYLEADLEVLNEPDYMPEKARAELHAALAQSMAELEAGQVVSAEEVLAELRARR
jgi:hypothetical protein